MSQFTAEAPGQRTLKEIAPFPKDVYSVGRLDKDSEGLLLLTNDGRLNKALTDPKSKSSKTYYAQVEGIPTQEAINALRKGVRIKINKKYYKTLPAKVKLLNKEPELPERDPPIRYRKNIPTSWIQISITEGKNRQVRKMCASVDFPVLRLVRVAIKGLHYNQYKMKVGDVVELDKIEAYR